jgi:hypothetical protein
MTILLFSRQHPAWFQWRMISDGHDIEVRPLFFCEHVMIKKTYEVS